MTGKENKSLYFVALVPPEPIFTEVLKVKEELSSSYNTKAALNSPPHITLHMPFNYASKEEQRIVSALNKVRFQPFPVIQEGFGAFPPRVIYVNVESSSALTALHESVTKVIRLDLRIVKDTYRNQGFKPHMTVAFRDLRPAKFKEAWKTMEKVPISFSWEARSFFLLKHDGHRWGLLKEFGDT
ncbi:MAG: 2'-5' RNA ligase family protein [Cyclobacteriaceae bacterium]|nr:2'-5' RNA ligase family protein [Cyclobacteriaceae bacterium SS2]